MKIVVSFSGGKDSQACLIWAVKKYGAKNVQAVFCDTGWEHELTYKHIQDTCSLIQIELITLKPELDFVELAKKKGRFPSTMARFCTVELKIKPMIDWITSQDESLIIIQGIRAKENKEKFSSESDMRTAEYLCYKAIKAHLHSSRWRKVSEELPKTSGSYLVKFDNTKCKAEVLDFNTELGWVRMFADDISEWKPID